MKRKITIILPLLLVIIAGLISCKNNSEKSNQRKIETQEIETLNEEIKDAVYPLPTSAEVIKMLTELEVGYIIGISNPTENVSKYLTSKSKALNMGIYGADLSYATLYNMNQDVINYLDAIRALANDLNMSTLYNEKIYEQIRNSFDDKVKLVSILTTTFNGTYNYLSDNDQQALALMVVAGAWVEGMYITTHISESVFHVEGIVKVLLEQKQSFELFIDIAQPHKEDPMVGEILQLFEPMRLIYEDLDTSLSLKNVEDITQAIDILRDKLIS